MKQKFMIASIALGAIAVASPACSTDRPVFELRGVVQCGLGGAMRFAAPESGKEICTLSDDILTSQDVVDAEPVDKPQGRHALGLVLNDNASARLFSFSRRQVGHQIVILIDHKLVSAPVLITPLQTQVIEVDGPALSKAAISALVARFRHQPPI